MNRGLNFLNETHRMVSFETEWISAGRAIRLTQIFLPNGEQKRSWGIMALPSDDAFFRPATEDEVGELEDALLKSLNHPGIR